MSQYITLTAHYCHITLLSQYITVTLHYCHITLLSQYITVTIHYCHSTLLSHYITVTVHYCQYITVTVHYHTASPKPRHFSNRRRQSVFCVISHHVTTFYTTRSSLIVWMPRFCFCAVMRWKSLGDDFHFIITTVVVYLPVPVVARSKT